MKEYEIKDLEDSNSELPTQFYIYMGTYYGLIFSDAMYNCKHFYIDNINAIERYPDNVIKTIDLIAKRKFKITFNINTTQKGIISKLQKHFKMISCVAIPTGYEAGFQYHAIFFTNMNVRNRAHYIDRFVKDGVGMISDARILEGNRLPELVKVEETKNNTSKEQADRILKYKSKTWLKKYLLTLIS